MQYLSVCDMSALLSLSACQKQTPPASWILYQNLKKCAQTGWDGGRRFDLLMFRAGERGWKMIIWIKLRVQPALREKTWSERQPTAFTLNIVPSGCLYWNIIKCCKWGVIQITDETSGTDGRETLMLEETHKDSLYARLLTSFIYQHHS